MPENPTVPPAHVLVVAVALVDGAGRLCLQQRPLTKQHGGLWEFPGGKVETGESPRCALVREISEELGVGLDPMELVPAGFADSERLSILLFACREWTGEVQCLEGEAIGWFAPADMAELAMPPLDLPLVERVGQLLAAGAI